MGRIRIGADSGLVPLDQLGQRGARAVAVESAFLVRRDHVEIAAGTDDAMPLLQRLDRIGEMLDDVGADHEVDAAVLEREFIAGRNDIDRQGLAAELDLFLLEDGHSPL